MQHGGAMVEHIAYGDNASCVALGLIVTVGALCGFGASLCGFGASGGTPGDSPLIWG